jgi:hypothetical protein
MLLILKVKNNYYHNLKIGLCSRGAVCFLQTKKQLLKYNVYKLHVFPHLSSVFQANTENFPKLRVAAACFPCSSPILSLSELNPKVWKLPNFPVYYQSAKTFRNISHVTIPVGGHFSRNE